jgi:hypothetical protein
MPGSSYTNYCTYVLCRGFATAACIPYLKERGLCSVFSKDLKPVLFYLRGILAIAVGFIVKYIFLLEFDVIMGGTYAAYLQNLLMSVLFIQMLVQRGSREGQTMLIAVSKFIGSLAPTIAFGVLGVGAFSDPQPFVLVVGLLMALFVVIYIVMLAKKPSRWSCRHPSPILRKGTPLSNESQQTHFPPLCKGGGSRRSRRRGDL